MKVSGPRSGDPIAGAGGVRRPAADGFAPAGAEETRDACAPSRAAAPAALASLDALMALQAAPEPLERRRRAVRRAGGLLDVLDEVKLALLDGRDSSPALERLRRVVSEARDQVDDPGLGDLLDHIETRAAVELARQEVARAAA